MVGRGFAAVAGQLNLGSCFVPQTVSCGVFSSEKKLAAICFGRVPGACPPCVRHLSALGPLWPHLQVLCLPCCSLCPPCVRSLSFLGPLIVRSLFALCPLVVGFLAGSMVWLRPGLCQLCVRCLNFARSSVLCPLLSAFVDVLVATPLSASPLAGSALA